YRSSIEHCYPQSSKELLGKWEENTEKYLIDTFGNLCLIEPEFNSSLSDNSIHLKRAKLIELLEKNNKRSASLKQVIMLMYNDDFWKGESARETIKEHRGKMLKLLNR
ncbi:GmrSD restriction endonuclease domain-containing protein, partial [Rodentibacter ratti]|uniref:GmrSD restriction endonuclease domain-containing protein n=1 Tax=Rodentibacter ratti TaxID=1906745 RepID=UPI00117B470D